MEMEDQEVEARSDARTHASGRYTLALQKTMSFWPSSNNFRCWWNRRWSLGKGEAQEKLEENISLAMLVEEDEAGRSPQEVLLDEEPEVLRDDPAPPLQ